MYRSSEAAYAALDFNGKGYITMDEFLNSIVVKHRVPFTSD
jgi:hypothetical protein